MLQSDDRLGKQRDEAIAIAQQTLADRYPDLLSSIVSYGALNLDPAHLVVWVLLNGKPESIPSWYFPGVTEAGAEYDTGLLQTIDAMRAMVITAFTCVGWPDSPSLRVGFDSDARVSVAGGWQYFK